MLAAHNPYTTFAELSGDPLDAGYIYYGVAGLNPITNPIPIFADVDGTIPLLQPVRTRNGYTVRNGSPAAVFLDGDYSITVQDRNHVTVFYEQNSADFDSASKVLGQISALAGITDPAGGAGAIGLNVTLGYPANTAGGHIVGEPVDPCDYPFLCPTDGISDCSAAISAAHALGRGVRLRAGTFKFNIDIPDSLFMVGVPDNTVVSPYNATKPVIISRYNANWRYQVLSGLHFRSAAQFGVGFCFGDPDNYETGVEFAGRVHFSHIVFEGFDKGLKKPWGNIGNRMENVTYLENNYGHWSRGAQYGNTLSTQMHAGNDTWVDCEWDNNKKAGLLVLDNTPGAGGWNFLGNCIFQNNQGFGVFFDLDLPFFTAYAAIQEQNTWYEANGQAASVSVDTLTGPQVFTPPTDRRLGNDSAELNLTRYGRTMSIGTQRETASINIHSSNRPVMDWLCDYAADISRSNVIRAVERVGSVVLASFGFFAQSASETVFQVANGTLGLLRLLKNGSFVLGTTNPSAPGVHRIGGIAGIGVGSGPMLEIAADGGANSLTCYAADSNNASTANTAVGIGRNFTNGRSVNAGGTVNVGGADYAEYMRKRSDCGVIAAGAICGIDAAGLLTDQWALAVTFAIKSTNPSFVGGDTWGIALDGADLEAARLTVDRIAFSGQVPINLTGAVPGNYVIPASNGAGISATAVAAPTYEQYRVSIGRVVAIESDGRARVLVKVA